MKWNNEACCEFSLNSIQEMTRSLKKQSEQLPEPDCLIVSANEYNILHRWSNATIVKKIGHYTKYKYINIDNEQEIYWQRNQERTDYLSYPRKYCDENPLEPFKIVYNRHMRKRGYKSEGNKEYWAMIKDYHKEEKRKYLSNEY
jgi:hypothetical protein